MSVSIEWKPEKAGPHGVFVAEAFLSLLTRGEKGLTEPELLVREAAQNSWDARVGGGSVPVTMDFRVRNVVADDGVGLALREFFAGLEEASHSTVTLKPLRRELSLSRTSVLYVRDSGSRGLGGPVDASVAVPEGGSNNYVKFLLNIGDKNEDTRAGGSYGLGRSVFWRMSTCRTVVVYTRFADGDGFATRLVGLTIGAKFAKGGFNYTGRHWWTSSEVGQPLVGMAADDWAMRLGFDHYVGTETGTTVMVLGPDSPLGSTDPARGSADLAGAIAHSIELHLWPKYLSLHGRTRSELMEFSVRNGDESVPVREFQPREGVGLEATPLGQYIGAFEEILRMSREASPGVSNSIKHSARLRHRFNDELNHIEEIGLLAFRSIPKEEVRFPPLVESTDEDDGVRSLQNLVASKIASLRNSVALMRAPELIVAYKDVDGLCGVDHVSFGVFRASEATNQWFRLAESSTHTEWSVSVIPPNPDNPKRWHPSRRILQEFEKKLKSQLREWFPAPVPPPIRDDGQRTLRLDEVSRIMGESQGFLDRGLGFEFVEDDDTDQPVPDPSPDDDSPPPSARRGSVRINGQSLEVGGSPGEEIVLNVWEVSFVLSRPSHLELKLQVVLDDGRTFEKVDESSDLPCFHKVEWKDGLEVECEKQGTSTSLKTKVIDVKVVEGKKIERSITVKVAYEPGTTPALEARLVDA